MKTLLLGGSHEAHQIALSLGEMPQVSLAVSLAQADARHWPENCSIRVGAFGPDVELENWLNASRIMAVIDATHPFASAISEMAARVAQKLGLDFVRALRPEWTPTSADKWTPLDDISDAAGAIPAGSCVFLATGRRDLARLGNLSACRLLCRVRTKPPQAFPYPNGGFIYAPGPFTVAGERALFERENVDWIVTRNSGGDGSWPKLEAARALGLPVAMIRRPPLPSVPVVETVDAALNWVRERL